jgi:hypothetical protein
MGGVTWCRCDEGANTPRLRSVRSNTHTPLTRAHTHAHPHAPFFCSPGVVCFGPLTCRHCASVPFASVCPPSSSSDDDEDDDDDGGGALRFCGDEGDGATGGGFLGCSPSSLLLPSSLPSLLLLLVVAAWALAAAGLAGAMGALAAGACVLGDVDRRSVGDEVPGRGWPWMRRGG